MNRDNFRFFFQKVKNRFKAFRKKAWKFIDMELVSLRGFKPFANADGFKLRLQAMLGLYDSSLLCGISHVDHETIISLAERAMNHEFDLLGSGPVTLDPINWHVDFKTGAEWEKKWYREIGYLEGADIKMPWELSRCQHLLWLGEAYLLTKQEKYAQEIIDEINWWIDDNPFMYSVNWTCSMDVAFRAVNWMYAINMISEYQGVEDTFTTKVTKSLWQHGFFIRNNLEKVIPLSNNHYTSDLVGLLYLGELFGTFTKGRKWLRFALKEFCGEINKQVLPSGVHYERSVSYHRMMTEMLSYPLYMLQRLGESIPFDLEQRIRKMYGYIATYTKPNGLAPLIADNDDGRFAPFLRRDFRYHAYLNDENSIENRIVSVGMKPMHCAKEEGSKLYSDANVSVQRYGDSYLYINNGGYSKKPKESDVRIPTHTHNDLLSFELSIGGEDIIIDAGTFLYTSSKLSRDEFRSTAKHNTVMVDEEEQNEFGASFELIRNVRVGRLKQTGSYQVEGDYSTIKDNLHHKRIFSFSEKKLMITDLLSKEGTKHTAKLYFHFAKELSPVVESNLIAIKGELKMYFNIIPSVIEIIDDTVSPSFGVIDHSKTAIVSFEFDNEIMIKTIIS